MYQKVSRAILWVFPRGMKPTTGKASYTIYNGLNWYEMTIYNDFNNVYTKYTSLESEVQMNHIDSS